MIATCPNEEPRPSDSPIEFSVVERPQPAPACLHEFVIVREHERIAVVSCCLCPYQSIATVWEFTA